MMIGATAAVAANIKAGKRRALAMTSQQRIPAYADVPTMAELGYPGITTLGWTGIVVAAGTPKAVIARLHGEIEKVLEVPEMRSRLDALGMVPAKMGAEEFGAHIRSELQRWAKVVREVGVKLD